MLFGISAAYSQYAELAGKPYNQRLDAIHRLYRDVVELKVDTSVVADTLAGMRSLADRLGDKELSLEADLLEAFYDYRNISGDVNGLERVMEAGIRQHVHHIAIRAAYVLGNHHWEQSAYEYAFRWYARLDSLMQPVSVIDFPNKVAYLKQIGFAHYHFGDYRLAIDYFRMATQEPITPFYERDWKHCLNNMGLTYQKLGQLDRADSCFLAIFANNTLDKEVWEGIASGNLGYNQYLRHNYTEAIPLFERDIRIALKYSDYGLAAGSATPLADILVKQGELAIAKPYIDSAYSYIARSGQTDRMRLLYPVMGRWYAARGDAARASLYIDSMQEATARHQEKFNALKLLRAKQQVMASHREASLQLLRTESQQKLNQRNLILAGLLVALLIILFLGYRMRKLNELRIKDRDLKLFTTARELQGARGQLETLAREATAKSLRTQELERSGGAVDGNDALIEQLTRQAVLTDEGWRRFSELLNRVHPGFQQTLTERYPTLTPAEVRCLAMEKLQFGNKEMAALQGISTNAVMVTKHRIRRKLDLPGQQALERFVAGI